MSYTVERQSSVYNNDDGSCVRIVPDADGLDLVEFQQIENGKIVARITMTKEQAILFVDASKKYLEETS